MLLREGSGVCLFLIAVSQQEEKGKESSFKGVDSILMNWIIGDDTVSGTVQHIVQFTPHLNSKKTPTKEQLSKSKHKGQIKETHIRSHERKAPLSLGDASSGNPQARRFFHAKASPRPIRIHDSVASLAEKDTLPTLPKTPPICLRVTPPQHPHYLNARHEGPACFLRWKRIQ